MKVIKATVMGYCMGVRRAVSMALETAAQASGRRVFCLGPLIHNPQALERLAAAGVRTIDERAGPSAEDSPASGDIVIIRAHGLPPATLDRLENGGITVVDATCPRVTASQRRAVALAAEGRLIVLAGESDHGEIAGIAGRVPGCLIVSSPEEVDGLELDRPVALIGQTTITSEEYSRIADALKRRVEGDCIEGDCIVVDSICPATAERRSSLIALCALVDAVVVVGGKGSANTRRLFSTALDAGVPAWHVETADELPPELARFSRVGVSAGASTPDEETQKVVDRLASM